MYQKISREIASFRLTYDAGPTRDLAGEAFARPRLLGRVVSGPASRVNVSRAPEIRSSLYSAQMRALHHQISNISTWRRTKSVGTIASFAYSNVRTKFDQLYRFKRSEN